MRLSGLKQSDSAATAIEYAIIAGLIGLGLVGSLVTTRGSLSAVFGTAASQVSGVGADAAGPVSARSAFWSAKGTPTKSTEPWTAPNLTGGTATGTRTNLTYGDGTRIEFYNLPGTSSPLRVLVYDAINGENTNAYLGDTGKLNLYIMNKTDPATGKTQYTAQSMIEGVNQYNSSTLQDFTGDPPVPPNETLRLYADGRWDGVTRSVAPTDTFIGQAQTGYADAIYFKALLK
jgi:Flp pilus assembly pilin Flp